MDGCIAVFGATGAVGKELTKLLQEKGFSADRLRLFSSSTPIDLEGIDLAFFSVSKTVALKWIPKAQAMGIPCVDASAAFREDPNIPLVIPEINGELLDRDPEIVSSPNCTTTLMLLPLAPLHKAYKIKRIIAATYQAISGAGLVAMEELKNQTKDFLEGKERTAGTFPYPCAFNLFRHESPLSPSGYAEEEEKMDLETKRILGDTSIGVTATCVRVPIFRVHSIALNVEFEKEPMLDEARELVAHAPGVSLIEDPTPLGAEKAAPVFCGRLRKDKTNQNALELWVVGDQLLKGAALNMMQIGERLLCNKHKKIGSGGR